MGLFDSISNIFGGAPNGAGFQAASAPITAGTNAQQVTGAFYNNQDALAQQQQLLQALQSQNGIGNQSQVYGQLQGVVNGSGPNPAQAMLNQATGANVANQAALMAGQRGASANPALIARQAAQQGGALQQQAAGQGATLQAQQSLNALGQAGTLAGQQVSNQIGAVGANTAANQTEQAQLLAALAAQNNANVANTGNMNSANAGMAGVNANNTAKAVGGLLNAGGGAIGLQGLGGGGGGVASAAPAAAAPAGQAVAAGAFYQGGKVRENPKLANVSESDRYSDSLYPSHLKEMKDMYHGSLPMKSGGPVPGRAKVSGDSPKNDTVDAKLSPGEVVIPKSIMESDDPAARAAKFVSDLLKKGTKNPEGDFKEALRKAIAGRKKK